jgi:glucose/arabinose dehydrogenase
MRTRRALLVVGLLLSAGCSKDSTDKQAATATTASSSSTAPSSTATTRTAGPPAPVRIKLTQVARLDQPVAMAVRPSDKAVFVAEKTGRVRPLNGGPALVDVSGDLSLGSEQGLLGLVFSPDSTRLYINYTDRKGDTHIVEYAGANRRELLFVDQPFANHNGGQLAFGPDGLLYAGLGDGGSGNDPKENAQNPNTVLGKIVRWRLPDPKPEIWAHGLRNPWRFSFDRATGDLWIGDVGQDHWEEVDVDRAPLDADRNYGWPQREGRHANKSSPTRGPLVEPEYEINHAGGNCSVTGGYVYRGGALKASLDGAYLFADYCKGDLFALRDGKASALGQHVDSVASFGEDAVGEVYVLSLKGPVFRIDPA